MGGLSSIHEGGVKTPETIADNFKQMCDSIV